MSSFDKDYQEWLDKQIAEETNPRRLERLKRGLSRGTVEFLRSIWYPAIGNFNDLYAEFEVRDFNNGYRYLDLAYMPGHAKGCIEIQDYRSHARDIEMGRFKDLCMRHSLLALDDWQLLTIAYLSMRDDPGMCKQLILSFVGKFLSQNVQPELPWAEAETLRFARRLLRPFTPGELGTHLRLSRPRIGIILQHLVTLKHLEVVGGKQRYRSFQLVLPTAVSL